MLSLMGTRGWLCDSWSRREVVSVGGLTLLGLGLPELLRAKETAPAAGPHGFARADSVIFVYLQGSPSHIDLWDPKPNAPAEIRGEFQPIATAAPGVFLGEVLPKLAAQADRFALVRTLGVKPKGLPNHGSSIYMLLTGHDPGNFSPTGLAVPPSREDLPSVGSVVARYRPAESGRLSYVALGSAVKEGAVQSVGQGAGLLGAAFDPFTMYENPVRPLKLDALSSTADVPPERLSRRVSLRASLESPATSEAVARALNSAAESAGASYDAYYQRALDLMQSAATIQAFQLERERDDVRDRYGRTIFGQSCLLARRLVEAGTRFVQVTWPAGSDTEPAPGPDGSWDTHRNNFPMLREHRCPVFDHSLSALIADLHERGLLQRTLVVAVGEFGRSPKIGAATTNNVGPGGRDHWPDCYSALLAGGGIQPGQAYGESDRFGAYPKSEPVHPYDLICTIHHALGIPPATEYLDTLRRPRRLVDFGGPILGLF